jgi:GNAT superfamily N-acetyltransferase
MRGVPTVYRFTPIEASHAPAAYDFHTRCADRGEFVWVRPPQTIRSLAEDGCLFGVWSDATLFGLAYANLRNGMWEIGGLTVEQSLRHLGIGAILLRFTLALTTVNENTGFETPIIAHVHKLNGAPRKLLRTLGFVEAGEFSVDPKHAPPNFPTDEHGRIVGDTFRFSDGGLLLLRAWIDSFDGSLSNGDRCEMIPGKANIADVREALRDIADQVERRRI